MTDPATPAEPAPPMEEPAFAPTPEVDPVAPEELPPEGPMIDPGEWRPHDLSPLARYQMSL